MSKTIEDRIHAALGNGNCGPHDLADLVREAERADAALEAAFQQTQTHHEGGRRLDAMMRDHQTNMATIYATYNNEMSAAWRRS